MSSSSKPKLRVLTLIALCVLTASCATSSPALKLSAAAPVQVQPLPTAARQSTSSPKFSDRASQNIDSWQLKLTALELPARTASAPTTP